MATLTVGDLTPRLQYTAIAGQTAFTYNFPIFQNSDLKVYVGSILQTLTTNYTVSGAGTTGGGTVTFTSGLSAGDIVTIYRDMSVQRTTDYQANGDLLAENLNDDLDKLTMMVQQNEYNLGLTLRADQFDETANLTIPNKATRADKLLGFAANGDVTTSNSTIAQVDATVSAVNTLATSASGTSGSVIHIAAGTGAVATTVQAKLREIISVTDYGAVGNSIADDTAAIQLAFNAAENKNIYFPNGTYLISSEVIVKNCSVYTESATIIGSGEVRGVIKNDSIPFGLLKVPFNISLSKNRSTAIAADFYVDPCLGFDSNNGTSATTPFKTLTAMRAALNAKIGIGADTAITVVLRDGRHEVSTAIDFDTSQATATVTIKANSGESPMITPETLFFFRDGNTATNPTGADIYSLFDVEDQWNRVPITTTSFEYDRYWRRNSQQAVSLSGTTATIVPDVDGYALLSGATNLSKARLRVMQSWSSSLYYTLSLSGGTDLDYTIPVGQTTYYYNGFDAGVNNGYAPYMVEGLDSTKTSDTWCNLGSSLMLPDVGSRVYTSVVEIDEPITISANKYTFSGVSFGYHMPTKTSMLGNYTGTTTQAGSMVIVTGNDCTIENCNFIDIDGSAVFSDGNDFTLQKSKFYRIGHTAILSGYPTDPETVTGTRILENEVQYWGYNFTGGNAVLLAADDAWVKDCKFFNGTSQAISSQSDQTTDIENQIYRNVVYNCGMPEGKKSERYMMNDSGAIYHNGLGKVSTYRALQNVVFNVNGYHLNHGIYIDNGHEGAFVAQNLVFNVPARAFDCRDVSSTTKNNTVQYNIFYGNVQLGDVSGGTYTGNIKIVDSGTTQDIFGAGVTTTAPLSGLILDGSTSEYYAMLPVKTLEDDGNYALPSYPLSAYISDILPGVEDKQFGAFTPTVYGSTVTGVGTYTKQICRWYKRGNIIYFVADIRWTAHTGSGPMRFDLTAIPYSPVNLGIQIPCSVWSNNLTFSNQLTATIGTPSKTIIFTNVNGGGGNSSVSLDTSAEVAVSGFFPI